MSGPAAVLVTAAEAAAEVGVKPQTIYVWVSRGYLAPATTPGARRLYRLSDVFAVEASRDHKRRKRRTVCYVAH